MDLRICTPFFKDDVLRSTLNHLQVFQVEDDGALSFVLAMVGALSFLLVLFSLIKIRRSFNRKRQPPEAGGAWPLIGHIHLLRGIKPPHLTLADMADKYGPVFIMRLGVHKNLIVSDWEIAKECFTVNDLNFATRPKYLAFKLIGYDYTMMGFSLYGPVWRQVRKIATVQLLSNQCLGMHTHIRESEIRLSIREMYDSWVRKKDCEDGVKVEMKRWFGDVTLNMIFRMVVGKRFTEAFTGEKLGQSRRVMRDFFDLSGAFVPADYFPFLRWLDLGGFEKAMKKTAEELDQLVTKWLHEHKQNRKGEKSKAEQDFMDIMLSLFYGDDRSGDDSSSNHDSDRIIKATCWALILGGSDTTTGTMTWVLCLLLKNKRVLKKAQRELDEQVGDKRQVNESDLKKLVYLDAIIKEGMRLYPVAPLAVPHESMEDCTIAGHHIPAGTRLMVNLWKMHRDPRVWKEPEEFQPERFLTTHKDMDVRGKNYEFMPFGSGRRMCPGISFALQTTLLSMAALLHGFEISTSSEEALDMRERLGITSIKETPLDIYAKPRLALHLYA